MAMSIEELRAKARVRALSEGVRCWRLAGENDRYAVPSSAEVGVAYEVVVTDAATSCTCPRAHPEHVLHIACHQLRAGRQGRGDTRRAGALGGVGERLPGRTGSTGYNAGGTARRQRHGNIADGAFVVSAIVEPETDVLDIHAVAVEALTYDSVATTIVTRKVPRHGREPLLMLAKRSGGLWYPVEPGNTQAPFDEWADELGLDYDDFMYRAKSQAPALRREAQHA